MAFEVRPPPGFRIVERPANVRRTRSARVTSEHAAAYQGHETVPARSDRRRRRARRDRGARRCRPPEAARGDTGVIADSVTTTGHGVLTVVPDEATVTAGVHTQAATAADALAQNSARMNDVIAALKQHGGKDLQTQQVSLYPQSKEDGTIIGYSADNSVSASTSIAGAGALIDAAVGAGANTVSGPTLSVSDQRRPLPRRAQEGGRGCPREGARSRRGRRVRHRPRLDRCRAVERGAGADLRRGSAAAKDAATPIEPGTQDVTADVTVTFSIR